MNHAASNAVIFIYAFHKRRRAACRRPSPRPCPLRRLVSHTRQSVPAGGKSMRTSSADAFWGDRDATFIFGRNRTISNDLLACVKKNMELCDKVAHNWNFKLNV